MAVARATGLSAETVAASVDRMMELGFMADGKAVPQSDYFFAKPGGHWAERIPFFKFYARSDDSPLTTTDVMVYSYILHMKGLHNQPTTLRVAHIANALCLDARTLTACFERLAKCQLLKITEGSWAVCTKPVPQQVGWFKGRLSAPKSAVTLDDLPPGLDALNRIQDNTAPADDAVAPADESDTMSLQSQQTSFYVLERLALLDIKEVEYGPVIRHYFGKSNGCKEELWPDFCDTIIRTIDKRRGKGNRPGSPSADGAGCRDGTDRIGGDEGNGSSPDSPLGHFYRPPQGGGTARTGPATTHTTTTTVGTP